MELKNEIAKNIKELAPYASMASALLRNCANCDNKLEYCIVRMLEAAGVTPEMFIQSILNRFLECEDFNKKGMSWHLDLNEEMR